MRQGLLRAGLLALAAALGGCADAYTPLPLDLTLSRVDPEEAAERAVVGAALGAGLGTAVGTAFSINTGIGSVVGAEVGALLGAELGVVTTPPVPTYRPITPPETAMIPGFYDAWPPGYRPPPVGSQTPPPRPG